MDKTPPETQLTTTVDKTPSKMQFTTTVDKKPSKMQLTTTVEILNTGTIREEAPDFSTYFTKNIFPKIESNRDIVETNPWLSTTWTNNNSKSVNHVIKTRVNWKSGPVVELINTLHDLVKSQYTDTERAFISTGKFSLVPDFETFKIPVNS